MVSHLLAFLGGVVLMFLIAQQVWRVYATQYLCRHAQVYEDLCKDMPQ